MSLYRFFESYLEETPELLTLTQEKVPTYDNLYNHFRNKVNYVFKQKQKRFPIEPFIDMLFYDYITKCSTNLQEYELLKMKTKKIAQISQKLFNIAILNDKLSKENVEKKI